MNGVSFTAGHFVLCWLVQMPPIVRILVPTLILVGNLVPSS